MENQNKLISLVVLTMLMLVGCKEKAVDTGSTNNPREYNWTSEALLYSGSSQTIMYSIWGSSSSDVYLVGWNDTGLGVMWHYDGKSWTDVKLQNSSIKGIIELKAIYGFSSNDIWAVGERINNDFTDSSLIIHYNGVSWSEANINRGGYLLNVWGSSPNDVWACGYLGVLFHFDGLRWSKDSISVNAPPEQQFQLIDITGINSTVYATGAKMENNGAKNTFYFFKRTNQFWQTVDSFIVAPGQLTFKWGTELWVSPEGNLFSNGDGIFKWNGSAWDNFYNSTTSFRGLKGTSEQNIFAVGDYGRAYQYNGSDWYQFQKLNDANIVYTDVWTDGKEAFIIGFIKVNNKDETIVWHGR